MNRERSLLVVGGGLAGLRAVESARATGWGARITLAGAEAIVPYDRPPLSKTHLDSALATEAVPFRTRRQLVEDLCVDVRLGSPAVGMDTAERVVVFEHGREIAYDRLVIATGANPIELPGQADIDGVFGLRTVQDADRIREGLGRATHVVVIGAGFIGSEVASAARKRGLVTTILDSEPVPMTRSVGGEVGAVLLELHRGAGTAVRLGVTVSGFEERDGWVSAVLLDDGTRIEADLVVVGIGARPATGWLESSGIRLHERDRGIVCGADLQTSAPGIWAAGDIVHTPDQALDGALTRTEHWTSAAETGAQAGRNATSGGPGEPFRSIPYFWSDWYGHRIQFVGSHHADAVGVVGDPGPGAFVLYRRGQRIVGALSIDRGGDIMKLRRRILRGGHWDEAMDFVRTRYAERPPASV